MTVIEIRPLTGDDAPAWRSIRLRMLTESPYSFGSTVEEFSRQTMDQVRERIAGRALEEGFQLGAFVDGALLGTIGAYRGDSQRERHKMTIWGVYVAPEMRGQAMARRLVSEAISRVRTIAGVEQVILWVAAHNDVARHVYEQAGFRAIGMEREALKFPDRYVDEHMMQLFLRDLT